MGHQQRSLTLSYTAQSSVMLAARAGLTAAASGVKAAARVALRGAWTGVAALQRCWEVIQTAGDRWSGRALAPPTNSLPSRCLPLQDRLQGAAPRSLRVSNAYQPVHCGCRSPAGAAAAVAACRGHPALPRPTMAAACMLC